MKKTISLILAAVLSAAALTGCGPEKTPEDTEPAGNVIYVAPDGSDDAAGTKKAPLATLAGAKEKVREILPGADSAVTVVFAGGDYLISESVSFDGADSGREDAPVVYRAADGERVRFIGGVKVDPSLITKADPSDSVPSRVKDDTARAALLKADVSSLVDIYPALYSYDDSDNNAEHPMELYLGETAIRPARWPNDGGQDTFNYVFLGMNPDKPSTMYDDNVKVRYIPTLYYEDDVAERAATWSDESLKDLYVTGSLQQSYIIDTFRVLSLDREAGSVTLTHGVTPNYTETKKGRAYFHNLPEELDVPGESYIDREAKIAYFYPTDGYDPDDVWLSTLEDDMLVFSGTSHIRFENLEFVYMRGNTVMAEGVSDITMDGCTLAHTSTQIAYFLEAENILLTGCRIGDSAHGGIILRGGDRDTLTSAGCVIENCDIFDVNRDMITYMSETQTEEFKAKVPEFGHHYAPALNIFAVGTVIRGNRIRGTVGQAILPMSNDIVIEGNEICNCVTETCDMAAIYYWNNPTILGLVIRDNYFHDIGNVYRGGEYSIYSDCGSMGAEVTGNLFVRAGGQGNQEAKASAPEAVMLLSQFAHVENNVFVDSEALFRYGDWSLNTARWQSDWQLYLVGRGTYAGVDAPSRFKAVDFDSPAWHEKYDGTIWGNIFNHFSYEILDEFNAIEDDEEAKQLATRMAPMRTNEICGNVIVNVPEVVNDNLTKSLNFHDNYTGDTSVFADYDGGDYTLTPEALAEIRETIPGFRELTGRYGCDPVR